MATRNIALTSLLSATLIMGGCATNNGNQDNQATGTAVGAVLGALLGKATGDHDKSRYVWGAIVGAIAGNAIGSYMDKQEAEFRRELSDSGVYVYRDGDKIHLSLPGNITFETGSANITPEFFPILQDVALVLNKYNKTTLMISGHTDDTGSAELNQNLSIARANSVKANLVNHQVDPRRITTQGYGEFQPLVPNTSEENRQQNRRVELTIIPNKKEYR
ncbi:OmpA family protein [Paraneptunicella aestuarii]|uniref:OmpA family protein n=1 Tax=Paraneptunicella aestuarii TaxID=2831148 RepID=UPI001E5D30CB|nr:OmpA family protein [Paraneptunicella aestuarii]UAA38402.1 OmpA family protein [Paraneptunicella aestuarii]